MTTSVEKERRAAGSSGGPRVAASITERDLVGLPDPARRYLRAMGVVGWPRDESFRLAWTGRFRPSLGAPWVPCKAWQCNTGPEVTRIFRMRLRLGMLPAIGHDTYVRGAGRLHVRMLGLFPIVDATGPEYDVGELVTWLDDAVIFAPSMLLDPRTTWAGVDERAFEVRFSDRGRVVTGRVRLDEHDRPREFETTDRYCEAPGDRRHLIRARWTTPFERWETVGGRTLPRHVRAIWHLTSGDFCYAEFDVVPESLAFNVAPAPPSGSRRENAGQRS